MLCGLICIYPQELNVTLRYLFLNTVLVFMSYTNFKLKLFILKFLTGFPELCFV